MEKDSLRILHVDALHMEHRALGEGYAFDRADIVSGNTSDRCRVRVCSIPPGKSNYPYHAHETHEEIFFMLSGSGVVQTETGERALRPGDILVCPAGLSGAHKITNTGAVPLRYLEFDAVSYPDIAYYPSANGVGMIFQDRERNEFYMDGERTTYEALSERG